MFRSAEHVPACLCQCPQTLNRLLDLDLSYNSFGVRARRSNLARRAFDDRRALGAPPAKLAAHRTTNKSVPGARPLLVLRDPLRDAKGCTLPRVQGTVPFMWWYPPAFSSGALSRLSCEQCGLSVSMDRCVKR
jgi:hypothetical protein